MADFGIDISGYVGSVGCAYCRDGVEFVFVGKSCWEDTIFAFEGEVGSMSVMGLSQMWSLFSFSMIPFDLDP